MSWMAHSGVNPKNLYAPTGSIFLDTRPLVWTQKQFLIYLIKKMDGSNPPKARKTEARISLMAQPTKEQQQLENNAWKTSPIAACLIQ